MPRFLPASVALSATAALAVLPALAQQAAPAKAAAPTATAEASFDQRGTHEHGRVTLNVAIDGSTLSLELDAPAINVIGFERAPRSAEEKQRVASVDRWLAGGVGMLGVPATAGCQLTRVEYAAPQVAAGSKGAAHDHDHDHEHATDAEQHADYTARYTFTCSNPTALAWADLWLMRRLLNVESVDVNLITPRQQLQRRLARDEQRLSLR